MTGRDGVGMSDDGETVYVDWFGSVRFGKKRTHSVGISPIPLSSPAPAPAVLIDVHNPASTRSFTATRSL